MNTNTVKSVQWIIELKTARHSCAYEYVDMHINVISMGYIAVKVSVKMRIIMKSGWDALIIAYRYRH